MSSTNNPYQPPKANVDHGQLSGRGACSFIFNLNEPVAGEHEVRLNLHRFPLTRYRLKLDGIILQTESCFQPRFDFEIDGKPASLRLKRGWLRMEVDLYVELELVARRQARPHPFSYIRPGFLLLVLFGTTAYAGFNWHLTILLAIVMGFDVVFFPKRANWIVDEPKKLKRRKIAENTG